MKWNVRKKYVSVGLLVLITGLTVFLINLDPVKAKVKFYYRNCNKVDLTGYSPLEDNADAWYTKYKIIAHSCGAIDGKEYTDSKEALEESYRSGIRIMDADLNLTADNVLVLKHDWSDDLGQNLKGEILTYATFMNTKPFARYTPMSLTDMIQFMDKYDDVYMACDVKGDVETAYKTIVNIAENLNVQSVLKRIIVSFYNYDDYSKIKKIYPFDNWVIRQYINVPHNYTELIRFCLENNIHVCNIGTYYLDEGDKISLLEKYNIHVFAAVVDNEAALNEYKETYGIDGIVSNNIREWE